VNTVPGDAVDQLAVAADPAPPSGRIAVGDVARAHEHDLIALVLTARRRAPGREEKCRSRQQ
jgi:hypothetical protein